MMKASLQFRPALLTASLFLSGFAYAQVGINNNTPKATLEVTAKNTNGTTPEGMIAPRLTGDQIKSGDSSYGTDQRGTLIYATAAVTTSSTKTANITAPGYYYFDGSIWQRIINNNTQNILGADNGLTVGTLGTGNVGLGGTLGKATEVNTNGNSMSFSGSGNFGLGTSSPSGRLTMHNDNQGDTKDDLYINTFSASDTPGVFMNSAKGTAAAPANIDNNRLLLTLGGAGRVNGSNKNLSSIKYYYKGDGTTTLSNMLFRTSDNDQMLLDESGRLGVGTTTPTAKLDVRGNQYLNAAVTSAASKNAIDINIGQDSFTYGNRTDNYGINMKTSSSIAAAGQIARINFGDESTGTLVGTRYLSFSVGKPLNELMYLTSANNGNVGIGTTSPSAKLEIQSTAGAAPLKVSTLNSQPASANAAYVTVDNTTGEFYKAGQAEKTFYYQTYNISNVNGDWISDFDTKISTDNYTVIIVGSYFDQLLGVNTANTSLNRFTPQNVYAFKNTTTNTWRLTADFPSVTSKAANASDAIQVPNGKWTIYTMIVRNNQVVNNSDVNIDLGANATGSATASPVP
ncbi:hypothetical protein [uncultured Chryseobacterium sp.]|uniref:hypothetical protein n=1 Tax=uncultured Chryseobacterium sp. TaxID=259322 RepID=UPI0025E1985E|nr:hypothetical protein [uncultured Chryseobacterium sp.]